MSTVTPSLAIVKQLRSALALRSDIEIAILFGSVARGKERADSDIDVGFRAPAVDALQLAAELSASVGREVHLVRLETAGYPLLQAIVRDGIILHEGQDGVAARWRSHALCELETDRPWWERMRDSQLRRLAGT